MSIVDDLGEDITLEEVEALEAARMAGVRFFKVLKSDGTEEDVSAHWHDSTPAGVLYFITLQSDGGKLIHNSFSPRRWAELHEVLMKGNCEGSARIN